MNPEVVEKITSEQIGRNEKRGRGSVQGLAALFMLPGMNSAGNRFSQLHRTASYEWTDGKRKEV